MFGDIFSFSISLFTDKGSKYSCQQLHRQHLRLLLQQLINDTIINMSDARLSDITEQLKFRTELAVSFSASISHQPPTP